MARRTPIPTERIEKAILLIRSERVMLDEDLAEIYGTTTKRLNEQVTRNKNRFPADFCFRLTPREFADLRSHLATARWAKRRYPPRAFTEHGAVMLASVLKTQVAVDASIQVIRTFVRLRKMLYSHATLARKLARLEQKYAEHDDRFQLVFEAIRQLMEPAVPRKKGRIGFNPADESIP